MAKKLVNSLYNSVTQEGRCFNMLKTQTSDILHTALAKALPTKL